VSEFIGFKDGDSIANGRNHSGGSARAFLGNPIGDPIEIGLGQIMNDDPHMP